MHIGSYVSINPFCYIHGGGVTIGDNVRITSHTSLISMEMIYDSSERKIRNQGYARSLIIMGDDVWNGAGAIGLEGVHIGQGSLIGTGAVVT